MTLATPTLAELSPGQAAILSGWQRAALLVVGGPGSGKTTLVGRAAVELLRAGGPAPLVLAATRSQASGLRNQIAAELGPGSWRPMVTTVHALARSLWQRFSDRPELRLLAAPEQEFRVRELLGGGPAERWPEHLRAALGTRGFAGQVRAAIARARQLGLDPDDLVRFGEQAERHEWVGVGEFFAEYLDVLDAEGVLDYAELVHRVRLLLAEARVREALAGEVGATLVDDFTELDPAQIGLVSAVAGAAPVLATADPDSVASGFRGADPRAVAGFADSFGNPERPVRMVELSGSHRFGVGIDAALAGLRTRLPILASRRVRPEPGQPDPSRVRVIIAAAEAEQTAAITSVLQSARLVDGIDYADMAVLVRSGHRQVAAVQRALVAAGVPVEVAGDEIALAESPAVQPLLLGLAASLTDQVTPDQALRLLTSPLGGFDVLGLRRLARLWRRDHPEMTGASLPWQLAAALNAADWTGDRESEPNLQRLRALQQLLAQARAAVAAGQPADQVAWSLWVGTSWPQRLRAEALSGGAVSGRAHADLDAACVFFELAAEASRDGGAKGVRAFLAELAGQQIPADRERENRVRRGGVQVLTPHRARGREWSLVVVAGVQEGGWPSGRRRAAVLDAQQLTADGLGGRSDYRELLAAERRLFHLACSRARRQLVVTATSGTDGEGDAPSRFLAELGVPATAPVRDDLPLSLAGMAATLRRVATDAAEPEPLRRAAAVEIARLAAATAAGGQLLVPAAAPARWWGIRELSSQPQPATAAVVRLSPSQVANVLTCPRRYFADRHSGSEAGPALPATLGSLTHLLVQQLFTEGLGAEAVPERLEAIWGRLPFGARWLSASERGEVERSVLRFLAWWQARQAEPIGVELPFEIDLELGQHQVRLAGKVDWLERSDAGLRVIDFKTARHAPTRAAVAELDQLGIYQLAIQSGGFAEHGASCAGAAAVYLRIPGKPSDQPKELPQPSLASQPYLDNHPDEREFPSWVHQRVAAAAAVVAEGRYPATPGEHCGRCRFASSCPASRNGEQVAP